MKKLIAIILTLGILLTSTSFTALCEDAQNVVDPIAYHTFDGANLGSLDEVDVFDISLSSKQIVSVMNSRNDTIVKGDLNYDTAVNANDLTILRRALLVDQEFDADYDINGDETVDIRDLIRLKKTLVNIQKADDNIIITTTIDQLRDPCILLEDGVYYAYGTGWVCYKNTSGMLSGDWQYVGNVVETPADANGDYWAPEVHKYNGAYYMFTTYMSKTTGKRGCTVLKSDSPVGPFVEISNGPVTPSDWHAIDGTLYVDEEGQPWMIFVREWVGTDDKVGRMVAAKMSDDLTRRISRPIELFRADDPKWATWDITDGCWLYKCENGELLMIWSNWDSEGYCVGVARSDNGKVDGNWTQDEELLYSKSMGLGYDGGHGMIFKSITGQMYLSIHSPNDATDSRKEKPIFIPIKEENGKLVWDVK